MRVFPFGRSIAFLLLLCLFAPLSAQQEGSQLTQFMLNTYSYNAGFAGLSNGINVSLLHRQQWLGLGKVGTKSTETGSGTSSGTSVSLATDGNEKGIAPNSTILMADMPIKAIKGGVGIEVASFNVAYFRNVYVKLGYAYHLQTSFGLIGMGVRAQIASVGLDISQLKPENASDPVLSQKQEDGNALYGDVGVGFYLVGNENYRVGIGFNNLVSHKSNKLAYRPSRTMAVNGEYTFSFPALPKVEFTPSTYLETDFKTVNWSIALTGTFNKRFWAGLSYRLQDAVSILAGVNIAKLQIGAAYDITASKFIKASKIGGAFEIMARYRFGLESEKVNTEYKNARYL